MRILEVISTFYPALAFGGPVKVVYDISKELAKRGHEVEVYTTNACDQTCNFKLRCKEQTINGFEVTYFDNLLRAGNIFLSPEMIIALRRNIKEFDVVHTHFGRQVHDIAVYYYAKKYGVPYVLQAHGSLPRIIAKQRLKWIYDVLFGYRLLRDASKVIALSRMEAEQYRGMGVPEEKIAVIPNGIDLSEYADLPPKGAFKKKFNIPENKKIILYLGRIHRTKGIDFLIKAYAYLINEMKNGDAILVIAGPDDGYLGEARQPANHLKIADKVVFTGMLPEKEKIRAYVDSTVCTYLRLWEPFGLVPLEAAACGTPSIVSSGTYMANVVDKGKFGFSVKYGDINELAEIMGKMLNNDELLREMGQRGRKFIFENCDWANIVAKLEKVYEEMIR